jgi:hypothetical protein
VTGEIKGRLREKVGKAALGSVAPKLLASLERVTSYVEVLSPIFVTIEVFFTSSDTRERCL